MDPDSLVLLVDPDKPWAGGWSATQTAALTCRTAVHQNNSEAQAHPFPITRVLIPVCQITNHAQLHRVAHTTATGCLPIVDLAVVLGLVLHPLADLGQGHVLHVRGVGHVHGHPLAIRGVQCAREEGQWILGYSEKYIVCMPAYIHSRTYTLCKCVSACIHIHSYVYTHNSILCLFFLVCSCLMSCRHFMLGLMILVLVLHSS